MNALRLKLVSLVLSGILLPQGIQAYTDIVDIPINQLITNTDTTLVASNEIIVNLKKGKHIPQYLLDSILQMGGEYHSHEYTKLDTLFVHSKIYSAKELMNIFQSETCQSYVESVSLNYIYHIEKSNDPSYNKLWSIENTGQDVNGKSGTNDADMDVAEAWEKTKGSNEVVVAVLDTGVDYSHTDLADNMWQGNANHGYDFAGDDNGNNDANPMPNEPYNENGHYHGTHVAGIIGAVGDNSTGISGVAQNVSIMAVKVFRPEGTGYSNDILEGVNYVLEQIDNGVNVVAVNASYGGGGSQDDAMNSAIKKLGDKGVVFCAAAGNSSQDIDVEPVYPASYNAENIITIAASDQDDKLASFSNYGKNTVDVAAPGTNILSTYPEDKYAYLNGTSMATPNVAGAIALLATEYPEATANELKQMILNNVDVKSDLTNKVSTNGRVNINEALGEKEEPQPNTAPKANADSATTAYETAVSIDIVANDSDADDDALSIKSYTQASHGTVSKVNGKLKYTPDNGYSGTDTFSYTITDGELEDSATVTVTVEEKPNSVPLAKDDSATTAYETAVTVDVVANDTDADADTLTITSYTQPAHGTVTKVNAKLTYTPESSYEGTDTFSYTITDGEAEDTATVTVTVEENDTPPLAENSAPVAKGDSAATAYGTAVTVDVVANDSDADGDTLSIKSYVQAAHGTVSKVNGKLKYTPDNGYSGTDTFSYTITDGELEDSATVTVTVEAQDDNTDDENHGDDTWYDFPIFGGFDFMNGFMGHGVRVETTEGSSDETFVGKFTKNNITTLITSYIPQTQAKLFMNNQFAIVDMHEGNMQLKVDENAAVMPRMPKVEDAVLPKHPLPVGTHVEIPETSDVKFGFTMTENIQF